MADTNITMVRGDTLAFGMIFEGLNQNLATAYFTVKDGYDASSYLVRKSLQDGISKETTGQYRVRVAPADTAGLEAGRYYYDLQVSVNDDVYTILRGTLTLQDDVTRL